MMDTSCAVQRQMRCMLTIDLCPCQSLPTSLAPLILFLVKILMMTAVNTDDDGGQFVSSVCWRQKSNMVVAANSSGSIKLLQMISRNIRSLRYLTKLHHSCFEALVQNLYEPRSSAPAFTRRNH